jgi:hypothetical protein
LPEAGTDSSSSSTAPQEHPGICSVIAFLRHQAKIMGVEAITKQLQLLQRCSTVVRNHRASQLPHLHAATAYSSQRQLRNKAPNIQQLHAIWKLLQHQ